MDKTIKRDYAESGKVQVFYDGVLVPWKLVTIEVPAKGEEVVLTDAAPKKKVKA